MQLRYLLFGKDAVDTFCATNNFTRILRGHQAKVRGVEVGLGGRVITVFSDSKDHGLGRKACSGCVLVERDGTIVPIVFEV